MRYRYRLSLYDDSELDKEIVDYLSRVSSSHRKQEILRTFIRAGFSIVAKKNQDDIAYLDGLSDHQKSLLVRSGARATTTMLLNNDFSNERDLSLSNNDYNSPYQSKQDGIEPPAIRDNYTVSSELTESEDGSPNDPVDFMTLLQQ